MITCLVGGNKKYQKYPEDVRKFCIRQQYYSTAAYQSLRIFFNKNLPAMRTLQLWFKSVDGSPGICKGAIDIIREKAESCLLENKHQLHLTLMWDDVSIRKGLRYCSEKQSFVGFSTYTNTSTDCTSEPLPKLAKEALVYMVVGKDFKIPVAYELCCGLEGIDRAALTLQVIKEIEAAGAKIISLTGDGLAANFAAYEKLGVKLKLDQPYFESPTYPGSKIYIILDPPHMLKLIRKSFASNTIYHDGQLVDWNLLKILVQKQSLDNFNLCNKLTTQHIKWYQKPMNVKLACETISNSVANTLEQLCRDGYKEFENSATAVEFLRFFNNGYDVLNFEENKKEDNKYKQRLCRDTAEDIFKFGESFKQYIRQLEYRTKTTSKPVLQSTLYTGFLGFYSNFVSLRGIYEDFVLNGPLNEFFSFQFCQDHLETFFSLIRYVELCLKQTNLKFYIFFNLISSFRIVLEIVSDETITQM